MGDMKALLRGLARGETIGELWKESGFRSGKDAARALERIAGEETGTRRRRAGKPSGSRGESGGENAPLPPGGAADLVIRTDGASRGNPGPASAAAIAFLPTGERLAGVSRRLGTATNNVAEYTAVLDGLELARSLGGRRLAFLLDSELVVKQLRGEYRIRNDALRELADRVLAAAALFERCTWTHVPRRENREADLLANEALDEDGEDGTSAEPA